MPLTLSSVSCTLTACYISFTYVVSKDIVIANSADTLKKYKYYQCVYFQKSKGYLVNSGNCNYSGEQCFSTTSETYWWTDWLINWLFERRQREQKNEPAQNDQEFITALENIDNFH